MNKKDNHYYIALAEEGASYDDIRARATSNGIKGSALRQLMREVDDIVLQKGEETLTKSYAVEWMVAGGCIFLISLVMLLYSFINKESHYIYLVYGGLIGGGLVFVAGKNNAKK